MIPCNWAPGEAGNGSLDRSWRKNPKFILRRETDFFFAHFRGKSLCEHVMIAPFPTGCKSDCIRSGFRSLLCMQSGTRIKETGFRSETKNGILVPLKKRLFNPRFSDYDSQLDQTVGKTEIFDPTILSD